MPSMTQPPARPWSRLALGILLLLTALLPNGSTADQASRELRGACYCRAGNELMCTERQTERECDLRSKEALCDEWFWKERLPCWNWGYGG